MRNVIVAIAIGEGNQLFLGGAVTETGQLGKVGRAVDLSPLAEPNGPVSQIRDMAGTLETPDDPAWNEVVDELFTRVEAVKAKIIAAELGDIVLARMGPALVNPNFVAPTVTKDAEGTYTKRPQEDNKGSKFIFLSKPALLNLGGNPDESPTRQRRQRKSNGKGSGDDKPSFAKDPNKLLPSDVAATLAVRIHFKDDLGSGNIDGPDTFRPDYDNPRPRFAFTGNFVPERSKPQSRSTSANNGGSRPAKRPAYFGGNGRGRKLSGGRLNQRKASTGKKRF